MTPRQSGQSVRRFEDERFLRGHGQYVEDAIRGDDAHGFVVRSPHSHAIIERIDIANAIGAPGVLGVFTEADLRADGLGPLPCIAQVKSLEPMIVPPRYALARERVRHVGDPVVFVVATSREAARDAAELVEIEYHSLPAVVDAVDALAEGAPQLWNEAPGNLSYRFQKGDAEATHAAFAGAARIVEIELINNRVVVAPIETRVGIGSYDRAAERYHLLLTGQGVHGIRDQMAQSVFRIPPERIHVVAPDVGGGFGVKNFLYPEWVLLLWAARRLDRRIAWIGERAEDFVSSTHGRDNRTKARLALGSSGRFLGLEVETVANLGAYLSSNGPGSSTNSPGTAQGGLYVIPAAFMDVRGAFTNTVPIDAYRGAGKPEANYVIERLIDLAAREMGVDPVALRRQNLIADFPYRTAMSMQIDCGEFAANLDKAVAQAERSGFEARRREAAARGKLRGMGVACFLETARGQPGEGAEIRFDGDGKVALLLGTQSNGQGHETSYKQVAADLLGLPLEHFRYVQADTMSVRRGAGHGGARSMHMGGTALVLAIEAAIEKGRKVAARLLQASVQEMVFSEGRYAVRGSSHGIDLLEVAAAARDPANLPQEIESAGLDSYAYNPSDVVTFPNGCHIAEVEIDPETGNVALLRYTAVDDYGRLINPMLTAGQVHGGVAQGIGQALTEHTVYDPQSGQLLSGSFMDYALPRADDLSSFDLILVEVPTRANPLGVKGSGQAGCIAAPQTIMNAILDALAPLGIRHLDMPATPHRIWCAIQQARRG
ncbi:MAG TPA: xanthine dehydrogenase family protein molybdopterin-binding subunit [Stellaceae bacterium]|nr:xanthine dehydrogenase family protein molybdopterin-binding subunit [Stellaceae bacterium]